MKNLWRSMFLAALVCVVAAAAQAQMEAPKPGPEVKKLDYFVGNWKTDGDMKPGLNFPGGKFSALDHDEWMKGGFFVIIHSDFKSVMGDGTELSVMGYDTAEKVYTYTAFNSSGEHETAKGTVDGDTWTWLSNETMGGMHSRFIMKILSPTSYSFNSSFLRTEPLGVSAMDGKATKTN